MHHSQKSKLIQHKAASRALHTGVRTGWRPAVSLLNIALTVVVAVGAYTGYGQTKALLIDKTSTLQESAEKAVMAEAAAGLATLTVTPPAVIAPPASDAVAAASTAGASKKASGSGSAPASGGSSAAGSSGSGFTTLPPGSALPSDSTCAARVRSAPETRPANATANATRGIDANDVYPRVTGNFAGSTDEIFQWVACKWGIDEDIVRAQAAKESWWFHRTMGDFTTDTSICAPEHQVLGADGQPGKCPESVGILQVRWVYHQEAFENNNALYSTAYNADYTYAIWRDCYEGNLTWLNNVEKGATYAAGDEWGCVGEWFSGRWYTPASITYINAVKDYKAQRIWEKDFFLAAQ